MKSLRSTLITAAIAIGSLMAVSIASAQDLPAPPAPGVSKRVDAIKASGVLRVGVLNNEPWLVQNTLGGGEPWSGPAWLLAETYAKLLGVKVEEVPVSGETKVTLLAANQADISITALGVSAERQKVVDFVVYSNNSTCMIGRADNAKFAAAKSLDDLNKPDFDLVYGIGAPDDTYLKARFANAKVRGVTTAIDEVLAGHADSTPYNRIQAVRLMKKVPGLLSLPADCQHSTEQSSDVGMAIDKNQPEFLDWLRAVATAMKPQVMAEEDRAIAALD
ncbi:MAG TPA: transporter substrate-binding domain-containing protein [Devosiaceae bacterium]|jgi:polar amino acid transport system substrate-binding protein